MADWHGSRARIEYQRPQGHNDHVRFYCDGCGEPLLDESFFLVDLGTQLKPVIERFYADEKLRTCRKCGTVTQPPAPVAAK